MVAGFLHLHRTLKAAGQSLKRPHDEFPAVAVVGIAIGVGAGAGAAFGAALCMPLSVALLWF